MKLIILLIFFLLANLFALNSMETISENQADAEDVEKLKWISQMYDFVNQNNSQQIDKLKEINKNLDVCLKEQQQQQTHLALQTKVSTLLEQINQLERQMSNGTIEELNKNLDLCLRQQQQQPEKSPLESQVSILLDKINQIERQLQGIQLNSNGMVVIQRRQDGSVDFYRNWDEYKSGFGNETGEFFIGLEKLHKLTNSRPYELLIVVEDWKNDRRYAKYDQFIVGSENDDFILKSIGTYSGSAGDSLSYHVGQKFSTKDRDQDASTSSHCATDYKGAWWYKECYNSNLNGEYFKEPKTVNSLGVAWRTFKGENYSMKFVEMILMPK